MSVELGVGKAACQVTQGSQLGHFLVPRLGAVEDLASPAPVRVSTRLPRTRPADMAGRLAVSCPQPVAGQASGIVKVVYFVKETVFSQSYGLGSTMRQALW